ncbi:hypothetical protein [Streptomyces cavernae]|uniref:hypothetical protein n=1 Tax=Streptomyces cavernae TaxID=2259034 RepID=UPI001EE436C7|nr:hypothetical protein [Streptomyces cavernae]
MSRAVEERIVDLSPPVLNRLANSSLGWVPMVACVAYGEQTGEAFPRAAAGAALLVFAVLAVRGYRLGLSWDTGTLIVRGYLRTRVIPRGSVTAVTDFPAVRWTTRTGRARWTPVVVLMTATAELAGIRDWKERSVRDLRRWARR